MSLSPIVVQKYGGSSVATAEKILAIADRIKAYLRTSPHLVVAVSAMGKTTDQLVALAKQVSANPHGRDYDLLLASGEQVADRKSTRLNSSHSAKSRMPSSA